ncbi:MAG TPA: shikimate kinase [Opitutus sp.]|nr:shikimate kinase [Opitutus sp.]
MKLVVLFGRPAVGKLTVARELATVSGWRLFHNHLVVDALLAVFDFGSAAFVELRERIWLDVFRAASAAGTPGLIFTFSPEQTVRPSFIDQLLTGARARGDALEFIELTCPESEIERRLDNASRRATGKITSLDLHRQLARDGAFDRPVMPPAGLRLDTSLLSAPESAQRIWRHVQT